MLCVSRLSRLARFGGAVLFAALAATAAEAVPTWQIIAVQVQQGGAPTVLAAFDKLMASEVGKTLPGRILLQANTVDGDNPATHSFVPIYGSMAEQETFVTKLVADPAWAAFQNAVRPVSQPLGTIRYALVKSWGDISDEDVVWRTFSFNVRDAAAFLQAMEAFQASPTGQGAPGQVHLSAVFAGGISPVTHLVSVGWKSEAEMESFGDTLQGNADWQAQVSAIQKVADLLGSNMALTVKGWGTTLKDALTP